MYVARSLRRLPLKRPSLGAFGSRIVALAAAPGVIGAAAWLAWGSAAPVEVRLTLFVAVAGGTAACMATLRRAIDRTLDTLTNALEALGEGEYSLRVSQGDRVPDALGDVVRRVNRLGATLQRQRSEVVETDALLQNLLEAIPVGILVFDPDGTLLFANRVGDQMFELGGKVATVTAESLNVAAAVAAATPHVMERVLGNQPGRYEFRRVTFHREGRAHALLVVTDLSVPLRREERNAWQRLVRVLSHEINNSLTPIKSIAHSVGRALAKDLDPQRQTELRAGLTIVEERAASLGRFLQSYAQLARLPEPSLHPVDIRPVIERVVRLERRRQVTIGEVAPTTVRADPDQLEQLLINLVRNAVDATEVNRGGVHVTWTVRRGWFELSVIDEGPGLSDSANLFVPFFTTKPGGSGIGLVLCRQIAENHGGSLTLVSRDDASGCVATLRLPAA